MNESKLVNEGYLMNNVGFKLAGWHVNSGKTTICYRI